MQIDRLNMLSFTQQVKGVGGIKPSQTANVSEKKTKPAPLGDAISIDFSSMQIEPQKGPIAATSVQKTEKQAEEGPQVSSPACPKPGEEKTGVVTNANGTLSIIEEPKDAPVQDTGGINFAKMFGVDTDSETKGPKNFTDKDIEGHYFAKDADSAKGIDDLSEDGKKLYATIKARYLDSVPKCPHGSPTLFLTGGLPGSGKGFILGKVLGDNPQMVRVDPDEIKKDILQDMFQKNPSLKDQAAVDKTWGNKIHETSSFMAKMLMNDALGSGKDIVFDSSMASKNVGKYRNYAQTARQDGYKVYGIISDVSVDTADERALGRADKPTVVKMEDGSTATLPGRLTERSYIEDCSKNLHDNLETYLGEGMYDNCVVFDNNSRENPAVVTKVYIRSKNVDGKPKNILGSASASPYTS